MGLRHPMLAIFCGFLAFMLSVGALASALGTWPPFMVVESRSMQHSDNSSAIGVIDTGDVVVVSEPSTYGTPRTYLDSLKDGYSSFGGLGDVVIYQIPGDDVPIVHRALCELVYNSSARGFDIPGLADLPHDAWSVPGEDRSGRGLDKWVELYGIGYAGVTVHIDLNSTFRAVEGDPHGGLVTVGDYNWEEVGGERIGIVDQGSLVDGPVKWEWVIGKVVGEVPWLGTLRLWLTGTMPPYMPLNSVLLFLASVASITLLPVALWASARAVDKRRGR